MIQMIDLILQKYVTRGKILMPFAFGPMIGNCLLKCLLNESMARENMGDIFHAVENSFTFLRKSDGYGKLFSIVPFISKWFPQLSGYYACRKSSLALYEFSKVRKKNSIVLFLHFCPILINYFLFAENHR